MKTVVSGMLLMEGHMSHRKILIIEVSKLIRLQLRLQLEKNGFEVLELNNAEELFAFSTRFLGIDLIVLEINLPGMDGITALEKMSQDKLLSTIPVVVLTGCTDPGSVRNALKAGAVDFIAKPYSPEGVCERIARIIDPTQKPLGYRQITAHCLAEIEKEINRARRSNTSFSILKLKRLLVNTQENISQMITMRDAIAAVLRSIDVVLLDNERNFLIILPFADQTGITTVLQKIYKTVFAGQIANLRYANVVYPADGVSEDVLLEVLGDKGWVDYKYL